MNKDSKCFSTSDNFWWGSSLITLIIYITSLSNSIRKNIKCWFYVQENQNDDLNFAWQAATSKLPILWSTLTFNFTNPLAQITNAPVQKTPFSFTNKTAPNFTSTQQELMPYFCAVLSMPCPEISTKFYWHKNSS